MADVIQIEHTEELASTKKFKLASWDFDEFNPIQTKLLEVYEGTSNIAIAASTSSGKTVCAEMYMAYEIQKRKGKAIYVGPMKALAKEKEDDWKSDEHHFSDCNISIVTGDYRLTKKRVAELEKADIIIMTPEMLASRCRNNQSDKSDFLKEVGTVVFDECFTEDALVLTEIGYIPIGVIIDSRMDVKVASFNQKIGVVEYKKIVAFQKKSLRKKWHSIVYNGGNVTVTENQAIWVEDKGYVAAKDICVGDILLVGEYDGKDKELDSANSNREECDLRNFAWRWIDKSIWNWQISTDENSALLGTEKVSRVEVQKVKEIGWHPSNCEQKWWLWRSGLQFLNSFISRVKGNLQYRCVGRKENCDTEMVGSNRSSNCISDLVYGRWQSSKEFNEDSHRIFFESGSAITCGLAEGLGSCWMPSISNEELLRIAFYSRRSRSISRNCEVAHNTNHEIQVASENGRDFLFNVWNKIHSYKKAYIRGQKSSSLFEELQEKVEEHVREVKKVHSEESICCDLEIEDNNNFFVMQPGSNSPILCHNSHLLTVPSRGDHIEVALMKMVKINPNVRAVLLSATMPNVDEICEWVSQLTNRDTYYLKSNYRPCPLHIHYESYYDGDRRYDEREQQKVNQACAIIESYPGDKFLVFVHTKMTGRTMITSLKSCGIEAEFHNADLNLKQRLDLEKRFRGGNLRVVVATSTLAWGLDMPARRVIVTGVHRGLDVVENYDIWQEVGRAGRPRYDPVGDAYILIPESEKSFWMAKLRKKFPIRSTLLNYVGNEDNPHYKILAFHVVAEIHYGNIKTKEGFKEWFRDSLAYYQDAGFDDDVIDRTINLLTQYKSIRVDNNGEYKCTPLGIIASLYYYSPFDVGDLRRNFHFVFEKNMSDNDFALAMAMGNVDTYRWGVVSRYEREQMSSFESRVKKMFGENSFTISAIKMGYAYYNMLKGKKDLPAFAALQGALRVDLDRTMQVIQSIDSMSSKWGKKEWFKTLRLRLLYGVEPKLVQLCQIPNVGQVRAKRLVAKKITTVGDFTSFDAAVIAKVMKCSKKLAGESLEAARMIELKNSIDSD